MPLLSHLFQDNRLREALHLHTHISDPDLLRNQASNQNMTAPHEHGVLGDLVEQYSPFPLVICRLAQNLHPPLSLNEHFESVVIYRKADLRVALYVPEGRCPLLNEENETPVHSIEHLCCPCSISKG